MTTLPGKRAAPVAATPRTPLLRLFLTRQFVGFVAVGGLAALLHWLARIGLSRWLPFHWAVPLAYGVGMAVAFTLNSLFVFPNSAKPRRAQARDFVLVNLAFFPVVWVVALALEAALTALGWTQHTQAIAHGVAVLVPTLATFLIYKFFAFKDVHDGRH